MSSQKSYMMLVSLPSPCSSSSALSLTLTDVLNSIFRNEAPKAEIDAKAREVENKGGKIGQRFESGILKGFSATMSDEEADQLKQLTAGGSHAHM